MSYILEALKKAEQQRELGRVPSIETVHEQVRNKGSSRWLWLITGIVGVNALVLLLSLWPEESREVPAADADRAGQATKGDSVALLHSSPSPEQSRQQATAPEEVVPPPDPMTEAVAQEFREPATQRAAPEHVQAPPAVEPAAAVAPPVVAEATEPGDSPLPVWPRIPEHLLADLSTGLRLDVHVYAKQPQERFVLINLKKYQEGETLQEGPRLDEITSEGVVLSYRGERFRVQAQ
jgi:general secretion pathway protein B